MSDPLLIHAADLAAQILARRPFVREPDVVSGDLTKGYQVQDAVLRHLAAGDRSGPLRRLGGYKIAFNTPALMQHFQIEEPCYAGVFADGIHRPGVRLPTNRFTRFGLEPELVATIGTCLEPSAGPLNDAQARAAIRSVSAGFELVELRGVKMTDLTAAEAVSVNVANEGAIVGDPAWTIDEFDAAIDLSTVQTVITRNGEVVADVTGKAPNHPVEAVRMVANNMLGRGYTIYPGDIILCGSHTPPMPVDGPCTIGVTMSGIGAAHFNLV